MRDVSKVFVGTIALTDASLRVSSGEIHGLLGENGAGKSTLIKILAGVYQADAGTITVDGVTLRDKHAPADALAAGVAFIHQDFGLVEGMSVAENIALVTEYPLAHGVIDSRALRRKVRETMRPLGITVPPDRLVSELPIAVRAVIAIARALALQAKVLVLDEPTASLAAGEVDALFSVLRSLRDSGVACVFVSHRMDEVADLCDRVTVLRNGETVGTAKVGEVSRKEIVRMIVGHDVKQSATERADRRTEGGSRIELDQLRGLTLQPFDFRASPGEIVGLTGLSDCGAPEVGEMLIGRVPPVSGAMRLNGASFAPGTPLAAFKAGIAYVPADRYTDGLVAQMSLRENLYLNPAVAVAAEGGSDGLLAGISWLRGERGVARKVLKRYNVRPAQPERETSTLSGGNGQKLLLAKWLSLKPELLILNEPTTGVDVGAREQIYEFVRDAAANGTTCLVITSDFEEVAQLCHRALVFSRGRLVREITGDELNPQAVVSAALETVGSP